MSGKDQALDDLELGIAIDLAARVDENKACQAVLQEMRAFLVQEGAPAVAMKLLDEAAARIELRRLTKLRGVETTT